MTAAKTLGTRPSFSSARPIYIQAGEVVERIYWAVQGYGTFYEMSSKEEAEHEALTGPFHRKNLEGGIWAYVDLRAIVRRSDGVRIDRAIMTCRVDQQ